MCDDTYAHSAMTNHDARTVPRTYRVQNSRSLRCSGTIWKYCSCTYAHKPSLTPTHRQIASHLGVLREHAADGLAGYLHVLGRWHGWCGCKLQWSQDVKLSSSRKWLVVQFVRAVLSAWVVRCRFSDFLRLLEGSGVEAPAACRFVLVTASTAGGVGADVE